MQKAVDSKVGKNLRTFVLTPYISSDDFALLWRSHEVTVRSWSR